MADGGDVAAEVIILSSNKLDILLVEDNPGDARLIREMLRESEDVDFTVDWVPRLSDALEKLGRGGSDLVLLDLGLPDSRGLETFVRAYAQAPQVPFVVLSGLDDETLALTAVREGAQDYLVKGQTDSGMLLRAIRYATERKRIEEVLRLANEELESRVAARTAELRRTNENLLQEVFQRQRAERALQMAHDTLELKVAMRTAELAKANMDLRRENEERRAAEMTVEAERQRLYALLDGLPGLVYLKAPDYSLRFANRLFRETCGEWQGKKCYEAIFKTQQPCKICTQFRVLETGKPSVKEASYAKSDRIYQVYSYPFADVDGSPLVLTLGIDISERKLAEQGLQQSQARLAKAQRLAHLGNWEWDLQSGEIIWSDEVYRIFGLNPEVFTPSPEANMAYVHPEDKPRVRKGFKDALAGVKPCIFVNRLVRPDGSIRYIQSQTEAVFDAGGKPRWILGTIQDITEPKVNEEKLLESEKNLRQLASQLMTAQEDERKRISQELHDELGQALLVLKLQTRSVEKELQPEQETLRAECLEMLDNIDQVVNNVRRLSHDLSPLLLEDLGLSVALERLIREFCKHYNIEYSNPETDLNNLFTLESQTTIYRIFQESLTNIGKHSQATRLTVSISRTDDRAVFLIQDNGKGFNPAQGRGQSRGMGLAAMKERVQMLGGTLSILSQEGTGTKISFDIPYSTWPQ